MKKQEQLLNKKRKRGTSLEISKKNQDSNNPKDIFIEQTYSFLDKINKRINEINDIRSKQVDGVLTNYDNLKEKKFINLLEKNDKNSEELDCCIVFEELYDSKNYNYNNEVLKIDSFDPSKDCLICFKQIKKNFEFICGHKVCNKCGIKWIKFKRECPVCRKSN